MKLTKIAADALDDYERECRAKDPEQCPYHGNKVDSDVNANAHPVASASSVPAGNGMSEMRQVSPEEYHQAITDAKASRPEKDRWRVDVKDVDDYRHCRALLVSPGGSCVAVKENGDIVSVCKRFDDSIHGSDLLKAAFSRGGTKLDSFDGNYEFYTRNALKPVSWTPFNEEYAPEGWRKNTDAPEPVVFFVKDKAPFTMSKGEWYNATPSQVDYDAAEKKRDDFLTDNN